MAMINLDKEATAHVRFTHNVIKEGHHLTSKIQYVKLVPLGVIALICVLTLRKPDALGRIPY